MNHLVPNRFIVVVVVVVSPLFGIFGGGNSIFFSHEAEDSVQGALISLF